MALKEKKHKKHIKKNRLFPFPNQLKQNKRVDILLSDHKKQVYIEYIFCIYRVYIVDICSCCVNKVEGKFLFLEM